MLDCCPLLQEYANVSYRKDRSTNENMTQGESPSGSGGGGGGRRKKRLKHLIDIEGQETEYPYEDIYTPD